MNFSLLALFGILALMACNNSPKPRHYTEIAFKTNNQGSDMVKAPIHVEWKLPDGWVQEPGGDPLRLASFRAPDPSLAHTGELDPNAVDVSIVQLAGEAGGLEANIKRWMGQIKIAATPDQIQNAIKNATPINALTKQSGILIDLTQILSGDMTQSTSILGAVFQKPEYTVFVKAMGDRERLVRLRSQIQGFCETLSIHEEKK